MPSRSLHLDAPIDVPPTLAPLRMGRGDPTMRLEGRGVLRATRTPDGPATGRYEAVGSTVDVTAWGPGAGWLLETAPNLVGANDDAAAFVPADGFMRGLQRSRPGLRLPRTGIVFEVAVATILSQKVTGAEAKRAWRRLVWRHSDPAPGPGDLRLPPAPETIARLPYHAFHPLGVERRRADDIRFAATRVVRLEEAVTLPRDEAKQRLTAFPGVGAWTAAIIGRLCLGDPDTVEVGDFHLPDIVAWNLAAEPRADDERMLELLAPYAGHRGRAIRLIEAAGSHPPRFGPRMSPRRLGKI